MRWVLTMMTCITSILAGCSYSQINDGVILVAPFYISDEGYSSCITVTNANDSVADLMLNVHALEGGIVAANRVSVPQYGSRTVCLDDIDVREHEFSTLGSLSVAGSSGLSGSIGGWVTIATRDTHARQRLKEALQPVSSAAPPIKKDVIDGPISVPLIVVHNTGQVAQRVSIYCAIPDGTYYESVFEVQGGNSFLLNACIARRQESRNYRQILDGTVPAEIPQARLEVRGGGWPNGVIAWGFAAKRDELGLQTELVGISFSQGK